MLLGTFSADKIRELGFDLSLQQADLLLANLDCSLNELINELAGHNGMLFFCYDGDVNAAIQELTKYGCYNFAVEFHLTEQLPKNKPHQLNIISSFCQCNKFIAKKIFC